MYGLYRDSGKGKVRVIADSVIIIQFLQSGLK